MAKSGEMPAWPRLATGKAAEAVRRELGLPRAKEDAGMTEVSERACYFCRFGEMADGTKEPEWLECRRHGCGEFAFGSRGAEIEKSMGDFAKVDGLRDSDPMPTLDDTPATYRKRVEDWRKWREREV